VLVDRAAEITIGDSANALENRDRSDDSVTIDGCTIRA